MIENITHNLNTRITINDNFTRQEIAEISLKNSALCPKDFEINAQSHELLRVLSMFSRCELKPIKQITSHRRYLGPLIVFFKKLSWPLVRFHLKDTFESIQQFNSWTVYGLAKQTIEIEILKQKLKS